MSLECYCILHMVRWKYHRGIVMYTTSLICTSTIMKDVWIPRNRSNYKKYETCHLHYSNTYVLPGETKFSDLVDFCNPLMVLCLLAYSCHKELKCCSFYINPPAILNIDVRDIL
jgi:hypothetical protein